MRRKRLFLLAAMFVSLSIIIVGAAGPGAALSQASLTIRSGPPVTQTYGPIAASDPNPVFSSPSQCATAPSCDTIPLVIEAPAGLGSGDDWFARVTLSWDDHSVEGAAQGSNLNLRIFQGTTNIARSSSDTQPEIIVLYQPTAKDYNITVINQVGANTGYTLTGEITQENVTPPTEFQEPDGPPPDLSGVPEEAPPPRAAPVSDVIVLPDPALSVVPIGPDDTYAHLTQGSGQLARFLGSPTDLLNVGPREVAPPGPVSGAEVLIWGAIFPLALIGAGVFWLRLRNPARLEAA